MCGLGAGGALLACLGVMAAGLLGGPGASIVGGGRPPAGAAVQGRGDGVARHTPGPTAPVAEPPPSPAPFTGGTPPGRAHPTASPSRRPSSPPATTSPSPSATNPAGKAPPGHNRTPRPKPSRAH
jgi:hypothetical protein